MPPFVQFRSIFLSLFSRRHPFCSNNSSNVGASVANNPGNNSSASGLIGGGTSTAAAKNQLEQLTTMRDALFSQGKLRKITIAVAAGNQSIDRTEFLIAFCPLSLSLPLSQMVGDANT